MSLLERLDRIESELERQKSEIKHLQSTNDIIILRAATLDDWSGQKVSE